MKFEKVLKDSFSGYAKKLTILSTLKMEFHCFLACIFAMEKSDVSLIVAVLWFISVFPPDTFINGFHLFLLTRIARVARVTFLLDSGVYEPGTEECPPLSGKC